MSKLREEMIKDMTLAGFRERTQESYLHAVKDLATYYKRSPDLISEDDLKEYFLYLINERKLAQSTLRQRICGIRFLFKSTLKRDFPVFDFIKPQKRLKLPNVLSRDEVLQGIGNVQHPVYSMALKVIYSCGLRIGEALNLKAEHIDRERMTLKVTNAKRGKDRYVPLPETILKQLEKYWLKGRPKVAGFLLFPTRYRDEGVPVNATSIRKAFKLSLKQCDINKKVSVHTLRHSYATHLLEAGVSLKTIQMLLGHKHLTTTMIYTHLTETGLIHLREALDKLTSDL